MAGRIRTVKPEWLEDEALGDVSVGARFMSVALLMLVDDEGRAEASDRKLAAKIFMYEPDLEKKLAMTREYSRELASIRYVTFYEVDGKRYLQINNFKKHQKIDRPSPSRLPAPEDKYSSATVSDSTSPREESRAVASPRSVYGRDLGKDLEVDLRARDFSPELNPSQTADPNPDPPRSELHSFAVRAFAEKYESVRGDAYMQAGYFEPDFKSIAKFCKTAEDVRIGIENFFKLADAYTVKADYSPRLLAKNWNQYRNPPKQNAQQTAEDAAKKWDASNRGSWVFSAKDEPPYECKQARAWWIEENNRRIREAS